MTKLQSGLNIREPLQARSRQAWQRVLEAGLALFIEKGYEGFTIAEICERSSVAPRFIYDRVDDKETLFLSVYLHGLAPIVAEQEVLEDQSRWLGLSDKDLLGEAVHQVSLRFRLHKEFLRRIVLVSSELPALALLGAEAKNHFSKQFTSMMNRAIENTGSKVSVADVHFCFDIAFANWAFRTAYGAEFSSAELTDEAFDLQLQELCKKYLFN